MANPSEINGTDIINNNPSTDKKDSKRSPSKDDIIIHPDGLSLPVLGFIRLVHRIQNSEELSQMAKDKKAKEEAEDKARQALGVMESMACFTQADVDDKKKEADKLKADIDGLTKTIDKQKERLGTAFGNFEESKNQAMHIMEVLPSLIAENERIYAMFGTKTEESEESEESKEEVKEEVKEDKTAKTTKTTTTKPRTRRTKNDKPKEDE